MAGLADRKDTELVISNLTKEFRTKNKTVTVLQNVSLTVRRGEFFSIVGSSGCGKSTLLRLIVGLERDYQGQINIGNEPARQYSEKIGMVFQEHRLLPWLTVKENVEFGLDNYPKKQQSALAKRYLQLVGLWDFAGNYPGQLSGGMQQRVAIARALAHQPEILLLDEPFGALDALTRIKMQQEILRIWEQERTTMILVTHDIDEAIYLGDRVGVMSSLPGTFKKLINIDLPRPRDRTRIEFATIKREIFKEFFEEEELPFSYTI